MKRKGLKVPELFGCPYTSELTYSGSLNAIKYKMFLSLTYFVFNP